VTGRLSIVGCSVSALHVDRGFSSSERMEGSTQRPDMQQGRVNNKAALYYFNTMGQRAQRAA
jgi:hypothetical protein